MTSFEPGLVLELMEQYRASAMVGVPTMLIAMVEHPDFPTRDLSSVKAVCAGGSTVPAELVRRLEGDLGAAFTIVFGQTECSPVAWRMGEEIAAFLRPAPGATLDRDALTVFLREHLSPQKTPRHWFTVEEYPLTGSGKIQKFVLRQQWEAGAYPAL